MNYINAHLASTAGTTVIYCTSTVLLVVLVLALLAVPALVLQKAADNNACYSNLYGFMYF
jgi:competence protein ComGC